MTSKIQAENETEIEAVELVEEKPLTTKIDNDPYAMVQLYDASHPAPSSEDRENTQAINPLEPNEAETEQIDGSPHQCSVCEKVFKIQLHLMEHMQRHSNERIYECSECSKK